MSTPLAAWHSPRPARAAGTLLAVAAFALLALVAPAPHAAADTDPVATSYTLPDAYVGVPYHARLEAVGGVPPYTWKYVGGLGCQPFPPGLEMSSSGLITGIPTSAIGNCLMSVAIIDSATTGATYHQVAVDITVQATGPICSPASFVAAFNTAADDSVITVCDADLDVSGYALTVPAGRHITLDLASKSLTGNGVGGDPSLTIPAGSTLSIINSLRWIDTGNATFGGINDDGTLNLGVGTQLTSDGNITGGGTLNGPGTVGAAPVLQNNGAISTSVTVSGVDVENHSYLLYIYQNDGTGRLLAAVQLYAATLGDAGISRSNATGRPGIDPDMSSPAGISPPTPAVRHSPTTRTSAQTA